MRGDDELLAKMSAARNSPTAQLAVVAGDPMALASFESEAQQAASELAAQAQAQAQQGGGSSDGGGIRLDSASPAAGRGGRAVAGQQHQQQLPSQHYQHGLLLPHRQM